MPNRILREGILKSSAVNSLTDDGEIFYRRLMSVADDYGRYEADPDILRASCFPLQLDRWSRARVSSALSDVRTTLTKTGSPLVTVYSAGNGENYLEINNFGQRVRASKSKFPDPPRSDDRTPPHSAARARVQDEDGDGDGVEDERVAREPRSTGAVQNSTNSFVRSSDPKPSKPESPNGEPAAADDAGPSPNPNITRARMAELTQDFLNADAPGRFPDPPDRDMLDKILRASGKATEQLVVMLLKERYSAGQRPHTIRGYAWFPPVFEKAFKPPKRTTTEMAPAGAATTAPAEGES